MELWLYVYNRRIYEEPTKLSVEEIEREIRAFENTIYRVARNFLPSVDEIMKSISRNPTPKAFYEASKQHMIRTYRNYGGPYLLSEENLAHLFEEVLRLFKVPFIVQKYKNLASIKENLYFLIDNMVSVLKNKMIEMEKAKSEDELDYKYFIIPDVEEDPPPGATKSAPHDAWADVALPMASMASLATVGILYLLGKAKR